MRLRHATGPRQACAPRVRGGRTCEDDEDRDGDADGVVNVAHDGADERAAAEKEDERVFVDCLRELDEQRLGGRDRELVVAVGVEELLYSSGGQAFGRGGGEVR